MKLDHSGPLIRWCDRLTGRVHDAMVPVQTAPELLATILGFSILVTDANFAETGKGAVSPSPRTPGLLGGAQSERQRIGTPSRPGRLPTRDPLSPGRWI